MGNRTTSNTDRRLLNLVAVFLCMWARKLLSCYVICAHVVDRRNFFGMIMQFAVIK